MGLVRRLAGLDTAFVIKSRSACTVPEAMSQPAAAPSASSIAPQIYIVATIVVQAGKEEDFLKAFRPLVHSSRKEPGCVRV